MHRAVCPLLNRREWKRLKGCVFSPPSVRPVLARGREARKRNPSITSIPTPVHCSSSSFHVAEDEYDEKCVSVMLEGEETEMVFIDHPHSEISVSDKFSGSDHRIYFTRKCRFMDKEVREISRFFVAPQRAFPLSVWRGFTDFLIQKYLHLGTC